MRFEGTVHDWNDPRGFGFVTPSGGGERAFVHIKAFDRGAGRPANGLQITYATQRDGQGRLNAVRIRAVGGVRPMNRGAVDRTALPALAGAMFCGLLGIGWVAGGLSGLVPLAYALLSGLSWMLYALDKSAAQRGAWRIPEKHLHLLDLLGGWPGGLLAQARLRHKSSKVSFQVVFWLTVLVNIVVMAWMLHNGQLGRLQQHLLG